MNKIGTTTNGDILMQISPSESTLLDKFIRFFEALRDDFTPLVLPPAVEPPPVHPQQQPQPPDDHTAPILEPTPAGWQPPPIPPPPPAIKPATPPAAKPLPPAAKPATRPFLKRRQANNSSPVFKAITRIMADGTPRDLDFIVAAMPASLASTDKLRYRVNTCLCGNGQAFTRTGRGTYRMISPAKAPQHAPAKVPADTPPPFDTSLLHADPKKLTDDQLLARMRYVKENGGSDRSARIEYIGRRAGKRG